MKHTIDKQEKYSLLKLKEEKLTTGIAPELKSLLVVINNGGVNNIILDLSETRYCDSSGLSAILVGNRLCKNSNGSFVLTGIKDSVRKIIKISQLDRVLMMSPTVSEGVDLIFMEEIERELHNGVK